MQGKESRKEHKYYVPAFKTNLVYTRDCKRKFMLIFPTQSPSQITYTINSTIIPHTLDCQTQRLPTFAASTFLIPLAVPVRLQPSQKVFKPFSKQALGSTYYLSQNWNIFYSNTTQHNTQQKKNANNLPLTSIPVLIGHDRQRFTQCWRGTVIISKWTT